MRICGRHIVYTLTTLALAACGGEGTDGVDSQANLPPIIAGTPITTLSAGSAYVFTPTAADPDGDPIVFRATNIPGWATFSTSTGALTGTPTESNVGMSDMIHIEVTDSQAVTLLTPFRIRVTSNATTPPPANVAPTIAGNPATIATVGQPYTFLPIGDDANDDTLTYSIQNAPSWITFTPSTGRLSGTPTTANIGTTAAIVVTVSDGVASASLPSFNLQVVGTPTTPPVNRAPTISGTPTTTIAADTAYSFRPVASDPDGNSLLFSVQNLPSWAAFSTSTGRLTGTPRTANVGTSARITISVSDGTATTSLPSFAIQVTAPANRAPTITGTPTTSTALNLLYSFQPSASDPDGNPLTFRIENRPTWLTFNTANGQLSGTPSAADVGTFSNIRISVSDGTASASLPAFSLAVLQSSNGTAVVHWTPPTTNADGAPLTDLAGFRVNYGRSMTELDQIAQVNNAGLTTYTVTNLSSGQWYFAVYAINARGVASAISNLATKVIP